MVLLSSNGTLALGSIVVVLQQSGLSQGGAMLAELITNKPDNQDAHLFYNDNGNILAATATTSVQQHDDVWSDRVSSFTEMYRTAARSVVHEHTQGWNTLVLTEDTDSRGSSSSTQTAEDDSMNNLRAKYPSLDPFQKTMQEKQSTYQKKPHEFGSSIYWDSEEEIDPYYFNHLIKHCSNTIPASNPEFRWLCWGSLDNLINRPRCTVQLDSRYVYNQGGASSSIGAADSNDMEGAARRLIHQHFTDDTLNVVIIGGGPSGQFLANTLANRNNRPSTSNTTTPTGIRTLVFENRLEDGQVGRKKAYTRNWWASAPFSSFKHIDPRIVTYLANMHFHQDRFDRTMDPWQALNHYNSYLRDSSRNSSDMYEKDGARYFYGSNETEPIGHAIPEVEATFSIMAMETLLLISNRDLGVKFLYDDFQKYKDLLSTIPNLVVFDASGHRLDKLDRAAPGGANSGDYKIQYNRWDPLGGYGHADTLTPPTWNYLNSDDYTVLKKHDRAVRIAQQTSKQGTIVFPVEEDTNKPYFLRMLKANDFRNQHADFGLVDSWESGMAGMMQSKHPLCEEACSNEDEFDCQKFCTLSWAWDATYNFRKDIKKQIEGGEHPFSTMMDAIMILTPEQYDGLLYMTNHTRGEFPLCSMPVDDMPQSQLFRQNNLIHTLRFLSTHAECDVDDHVLLSLFTYTPYVYSDPLVPLTADTTGRIGDAPLLRLGDSLLSGNPNLGNGLTMTMDILNQHAEMLMGASF